MSSTVSLWELRKYTTKRFVCTYLRNSHHLWIALTCQEYRWPSYFCVCTFVEPNTQFCPRLAVSWSPLCEQCARFETVVQSIPTVSWISDVRRTTSLRFRKEHWIKAISLKMILNFKQVSAVDVNFFSICCCSYFKEYYL